jgi:hypothetical protein
MYGLYVIYVMFMHIIWNIIIENTIHMHTHITCLKCVPIFSVILVYLFLLRISPPLHILISNIFRQTIFWFM